MHAKFASTLLLLLLFLLL